METFKLKLAEVQPSQLFIDRNRLDAIKRDFDPESMEPIPVIRLGGRIVATDGHTRALAAMLHGIDELPAVWDEDELDLEAYSTCVEWCRQEGVYCISDLEHRLLDPSLYQVLWVERCRTMLHELEHSRGDCDCDVH